ncbi:MAG TPA: hypothetical protein VJM34_13920 [Novosphingobium sp.]|nr:hypothetical protein [Novosphingobium sp.]
MRTILLAGAGALAVLAMPAISVAQSDPAPSAGVPGSINSVQDKRGGYKLTPEQQAAYDAWPADRRTDYETWPNDYQVYYWTLEPDYQTGYWTLTPEQRTQIHGMTPEQRTQAWASITQQLQANPPSSEPASPTPPNPATANSPVPPAQPNDPTYHAGPYKGALTAPPPEAANKTYPVCSKTVTDSCRNPGGK